MEIESDTENYEEDIWLKIYNNNLRDQLKKLQESSASSDQAYVHKISTLEMKVQGTLVQVPFFKPNFFPI